MPRIGSALPTLIAVAALVIAAWGLFWQDHGADIQEQRTTIAAVIDYQRILRDAAAARSIRDQIEARRKAYQEEISKEERRLHEADKAFAEQRSVLSAEALAEKRREFEQDVANVQRLVQERRRELDRLSAAALNEVEKALIEIVKSTAEDLGLTLVLPSSEVLFFARSLDLTEDVLAKLDASLPDVQLSQIAD
jgi:outer membrane protein